MKKRAFKLNKLVRDNIVKIHLDMGGEVKYKTLSGDKLTKALLKKLIEEAGELRDSDLSVGEIADLQEIIDALIKHLGIKKPDLTKRQLSKRKTNGKFNKGHFVDTVSLPASNKWAKYYAADPKRFPEVKKP
jgi:predicted house-cleaning noncanonical NTP pyrophosphatase (MazG superfamily)